MDTQAAEFYKSLFDQAFEPMLVRQMDGVITEWNRSAQDLYGYCRGEAVGSVSHHLLQTAFPVSRLDLDERLVRDGHWIGELNQAARDGRALTVESRQQLFVLPDGSRLVLESNRNISTYKIRYRLLFEGLQEGMAFCRIIYDDQHRPVDWVFLDANPALEKILGIQGLAGKHASELFPGLKETSQELFKMFGRVGKTGKPESYEGYLQSLNMSIRISSFSPDQDHIVVFGRDVSAHKQPEIALGDNEARLRLALDGAEIGTWDWNLTTDCLLWDERQHRLFGIAAGDFNGRGREIIRHIHPEDRERIVNAIARAVEGQIQLHEEFRVIHRNGSVHWLAGRGLPLPLAADGTQRMIGVNFDITARKTEERTREHRHKEEMARLYRIGTVNELASGLAHELSQPLTAIQNYAGGCLQWIDAHGDPAEIRHALEAISTQSQRVVDIIQHLRRLMTTGEPQRAPTNLNEVVTRALELLRIPLARKNVKIELALAPDLPIVSADGLQIEQVLIILIRNGIDAFSGEYLAQPAIELRTAMHPDDGVELTVADNGPGVPADVLQHIFEPFFTTKNMGLGLGLMLARSIIRAHNGKIWVEPRTGGGLSVRFTLPSFRGDQ